MTNTSAGRRSLSVGAFVVALFVLSHLSISGPLFPWSPVRPGYASVTSEYTKLVYPVALGGVPSDLRGVDSILLEVAGDTRLPIRDHVTVVIAADWGLFNRGALLGTGSTPLPVLGAALQTGTVVYLSPLVMEPDRHRRAVLRHELTHALMFQQMPLRRTFDLVPPELDWFEEGLAVHFGNPGDYLDDAEWKRLAGRPGYRFGPAGNPELAALPAEERGRFRLAEYRIFIEFLMDRYGDERFFQFRNAVLEDPAAFQAAGENVLGERWSATTSAFERAVQSGAWSQP